MEQIEIYTSEGKRFDGTEAQSETNAWVSDLFFGNVRLAVDFTRYSVEAWVFFWARDDRSSRPNQFFAKYETDAYSDFFTELKSAIRDRVEGDLEMYLETNQEAVEVFDNLDKEGNKYIDNSEATRLEALFSEPQDLDFGTNSYLKALDICKSFFESNERGKFAISGKGRFENISNYDLVVDFGVDYDGIEAIGDTRELEERKMEELKDRQISSSLKTIESEIQTLQRELDVSAQEIRNRLENRVPDVFRGSGPQESVHTSSTGFAKQNASQQSPLLGIDRNPRLIAGVLAVAGIVALLIASLVLFNKSPFSLLSGLPGGATDLLAIVLIIIAMILYLAKFGLQLPSFGSPGQEFDAGRSNLNREHSPAPIGLKIALVIVAIAVIIIGASIVGLPTGSLPFIGGGQSDLVIDTPANNDTIESSPFFVNGTTVAPKIRIIIKSSSQVGSSQKTRYYTIQVNGGNDNRAKFNQSVQLDKPDKYRIAIRMLDSEGEFMDKKTVWITYDPA